MGASNNRDFLAYLQFREDCGDDFMPWRTPDLGLGQTPSAKAFEVYDSTGEICECDDPGRFRKAIEGKRLLNFHITDLWVPRIQDALELSFYCGWLSVLELKKAFPYLPEWVWKTVWLSSINGKVFAALHSYSRMSNDFSDQELLPEKLDKFFELTEAANRKEPTP